MLGSADSALMGFCYMKGRLLQAPLQCVMMLPDLPFPSGGTAQPATKPHWQQLSDTKARRTGYLLDCDLGELLFCVFVNPPKLVFKLQLKLHVPRLL